MLNEVSRARAMQGFSPVETATFVFSLKRALFDALHRERQLSPVDIAKTTWTITRLLDELGLLTMDVYQKTREEVIAHQQIEIAELSTPSSNCGTEFSRCP
jgi:rsbT co-antagonist protein RsbR